MVIALFRLVRSEAVDKLVLISCTPQQAEQAESLRAAQIPTQNLVFILRGGGGLPHPYLSAIIRPDYVALKETAGVTRVDRE